jgi:hypothetical protein
MGVVVRDRTGRIRLFRVTESTDSKPFSFLAEIVLLVIVNIFGATLDFFYYFVFFFFIYFETECCSGWS